LAFDPEGFFFMKLRFLAPCLFFVLTTVVTRGQVGLYVNPIGIRISNSVPDQGPFAFLGAGSTSRMFYGVNMGFLMDTYRGKSLDAGVDVRDSIVKGDGALLNSFLVGGRVAGKGTFKPYGQASVGVGTSEPKTSPVKKSNFQWGVFGGVDYTLASHVDIRVVEVGYGRVATVNSGDFNGPLVQPNSRLLTVSTGLVFRIR
jgi:hypothetical protein